ncbi:hypothetical protein [Streptomyces sp. NPDC056549]|uniref:hypothetical protein n=1 Tax=Streptomyces sp. NPDC056549 TaxID=3345864 RepID=UPI00369F9FE4
MTVLGERGHGDVRDVLDVHERLRAGPRQPHDLAVDELPPEERILGQLDLALKGRVWR